MRKWIVFRAEKRQPGWKERKYAHTESLTKTLFEHYDCSDKELPEPGYRPPEFIRVDQFVDHLIMTGSAGTGKTLLALFFALRDVIDYTYRDWETDRKSVV